MRGDLPGGLTSAVVMAGYPLFTCLQSARPLRKRESRLRRVARNIVNAGFELSAAELLLVRQFKLGS